MDKITVILVTIEIILVCFTLFYFIKSDFTGAAVYDLSEPECINHCENQCKTSVEYSFEQVDGKNRCKCLC